MTATVKTPNGGVLNLREVPSGRIIAQIPNRTKIEVDSVDGEWAKVSYMEREGYVRVSFLILPETTTKEITREDLEKIYNSLSATLRLIKEVLE